MLSHGAFDYREYVKPFVKRQKNGATGAGSDRCLQRQPEDAFCLLRAKSSKRAPQSSVSVWCVSAPS
jgi:hypothetical protein